MPWDVTGVHVSSGNLAQLDRGLVQAVQDEGRATLDALRRAWLSIEVSGSSRGGHGRPDVSTGLRARVAAATRAESTASGARFYVDGRSVDPVYGEGLVLRLNGTGRPWIHPVFGRPSSWQLQRGQEVFFSTIERRDGTFRAAVERAMEDVARRF